MKRNKKTNIARNGMARMHTTALKIAAALTAILLCAYAGTVRAQVVGASTKCALVGVTMDRDQPDRSKIREIAVYIEETIRTVDKSYKVRGKQEIVPRLSRDGLDRLIAATTVKCRNSVDRTIQEVALEIYDGVREMQKALGVSD